MPGVRRGYACVATPLPVSCVCIFTFPIVFFSRRYAKLFRQQRRFFLFASRKNTVNIVDAAKRGAKEEPKGAGAEVFWLRFVFLFFLSSFCFLTSFVRKSKLQCEFSQQL